MTEQPPEGAVAYPPGETAYRHPTRGKAHRLYSKDPQPDPWDRAYSGQTICGFRLRWAFPVSTNVAAPEDLCRVCWPVESDRPAPSLSTPTAQTEAPDA